MLAESRRRVARDPVLRLDVGSGQERYRHVSPALVETGLGGSRNGRDATPLAIEDSMVSSLGVHPTREDGVGSRHKCIRIPGRDGYHIERLEWEADGSRTRGRIWIERRALCESVKG